MPRFLLLSTAVLVLGASASAQLTPDPRQQLKQIADKVAEEMKEIDRLLLERDASKATGEALRRSVEGIEKMLDNAGSANKRVQQGIDELIQQLEECGLCDNPGDGSGQSQQDQQEQQGRRNQQPGTRQENATPDMVRQPQEQQQQQDGREPKGNQQDSPNARNQDAAKAPTEDGVEVTERPGEVAEWGNLPEYLGGIKQRGGIPEISEKYRKLYDAYLRAQSKQKSDGSGR